VFRRHFELKKKPILDWHSRNKSYNKAIGAIAPRAAVMLNSFQHLLAKHFLLTPRDPEINSG